MRRLLIITIHTLLAGVLFSALTTATADGVTIESMISKGVREGDDLLVSSVASSMSEIRDAIEEDDIDQEPVSADSLPSANMAWNENEYQGYLIATAHPGTTMMLQGPALAIQRIHPEFALRLAKAIREARQSGLPLAGIFSAYRPPVFGIGGFVDKFNSLHTYGLAVDMQGIGGPGTAETRLWREIAARYGILCPYPVDSRSEWNHCQATRVKIIHPQNPLRAVVSADGPLDLEAMFEMGNALVEDARSVKTSSLRSAQLADTSTARESTAKPFKSMFDTLRPLPTSHARSVKQSLGIALQMNRKVRNGKIVRVRGLGVASIMVPEKGEGALKIAGKVRRTRGNPPHTT
jgi:hypothetical protein